MIAFLTPQLLLLANTRKQQSKVPSYSNIVVVRQYSTKMEELVTGQSQFVNSKWVDKLGKNFMSADGPDGLLVVAEITALQGPQDRLLTKLVEFGSIDPSGTIIDGKAQKELGAALSAICPSQECRPLLTSGKFRLQVKPEIQLAYNNSKGQPSMALFAPHMDTVKPEALSALVGVTPATDPIKARSLVFEEYYRIPNQRPMLFEAPKLLKAMADEMHAALVQQLYARCADQLGQGLENPASLLKDVKKWQDLPYDVRSQLEKGNLLFTDRSSSMPSEGDITGFGFGIQIQLAFSDGNGHGRILSIGITK